MNDKQIVLTKSGYLKLCELNGWEPSLDLLACFDRVFDDPEDPRSIGPRGPQPRPGRPPRGGKPGRSA